MNSVQGTVLILSRTGPDWRAGAAALCEELGCRVLQAGSETEAKALLAEAHVDIVIADEGAAEDEGMPFLSRLQESSPDILRVLAIGAKSGLSLGAVDEAGLYQLLRKPVDARQLALMVRSGMAFQQLTRRQRLLASEPVRGCHGQGSPHPGESRHFDGLVYVGEAMEKLCALARQAAQTDLPILIQGEPGTGKELMARALHYHSSQRDGPFIRKGCGAVTDAVLHADLFGSERKGAGESGTGEGLLRAASGGTLFLEDISDISRPLQIALLGWLQARESKPAADGDEHSGSAESRLIVSSTQPLKAAVAGGKFRQDLYFHLRGVELEMPPLRERRDDIPALACHFAARHSAALGRKILGVSAAALEKLSAYDFPGNVRELENEIRRMTALAKDGTYLTTAIMSPALLAAAARRGVVAGGSFAPRGQTLKEKIESLEKHLVREALARHKWNRSRVAEELGLSRVGLANKIRRYGLNEQPADSD